MIGDCDGISRFSLLLDMLLCLLIPLDLLDMDLISPERFLEIGAPCHTKVFCCDSDSIDLMKGLDYVVNKYSFIDQSRVAGLGASYGGYMVNWINGHTDRFACLGKFFC